MYTVFIHIYDRTPHVSPRSAATNDADASDDDDDADDRMSLFALDLGRPALAELARRIGSIDYVWATRDARTPSLERTFDDDVALPIFTDANFEQALDVLGWRHLHCQVSPQGALLLQRPYDALHFYSGSEDTDVAPQVSPRLRGLAPPPPPAKDDRPSRPLRREKRGVSRPRRFERAVNTGKGTRARRHSCPVALRRGVTDTTDTAAERVAMGVGGRA